MSSVDDRLEIGGIELHPERVAPERGHPAAGHHLDHVDTVPRVLADGVADRVRALHHPAQVVAVALGDGQGWPSRTHARKARGSGVAERHGAVATSPRSRTVVTPEAACCR